MKYIILALAVTAVSCESLLDQEPFSEVGKEQAAADAAAINKLVIGCYNALHGSMEYEFTLTELRIDNSRMYGNNSTATESKNIEQLDQGTIGTQNPFASNYWDACYVGIYRSNNVLENTGVVKDETLRAQYEAEAKFLRAHHYFNLVRLWGPVFLMTQTSQADGARYMQRSAVDDVYELIETDLEQIVNDKMLPLQYPAADLGRVTLTAAKALLGKVYLTHYEIRSEKYYEAQRLFKEVLVECGNPTSSSDLVPYARIFDIENEMNAEIIFAVRYNSGNKGVGSPFGNMFAPNNNLGNVILGASRSMNYPSDNIIAAYDLEGDVVRKDVNLAERYWNETQQQWIETGVCRYVKKYTYPVSTAYDGDSDWPVIRVGDIVLLLAEMENELNGPNDQALRYLNMTRQRAELPALTAVDVPSKYEFRVALQNERRLELAFENHRFFDLVRWGIATVTINNYLQTENFYQNYDYNVGAINDWQLLLPIPQSVRNINPEIPQNVGYEVN